MHSFAKTDTHAGSGAGNGHGFAHSGDEYAAGGAGFQQGGVPEGYDAGGVVDPNSFLGWPNETPGFAEGGEVNSMGSGEVDPTAMLDPSGVSDPNLVSIVNQNMQDYHDYHTQLEQAWNAQQTGGQGDQSSNDSGAADQGYAAGGGVPDPNEGDPRMENIPHESVDNVAPFNSFWQSDAQLEKHANLPEIPVVDGKPATQAGADLKTQSEQGYAAGGGIPPGPAGPGVTPQSPKGNPGRPGWTDPNAQAAGEKNYAQNVSSRQATSPARGTAFSQPPPIGGQRGQEWYGKGRK